MMTRFIFLGLCILWYFERTNSATNNEPEYTNIWAAHIKGGEEVAQNIAKDLGYELKGQIGPFKDYYELVREDHPEMSLRHSDHLTRSLLDLDEVKWAKQQTVFKIVYRDILEYNKDYENEAKEEEDEFVKNVNNQAPELAKEDSHSMSKKGLFSLRFSPLSKLFNFNKEQDDISQLGKFSTRPALHTKLTLYEGTTKSVELISSKPSAYATRFNDPLWKKQWYVQDYRTTDIPVMDHNVVPVYNRGFTGEGVTVAVVDSPMQIDHPDLAQNIDIGKSYDLCLKKPLSEILGQHKVTRRHSTSVAGIIAMIANNDMCGVGIAYNAKIAAISKFCDGKLNIDVENAMSLVQNLEMVDIYNFSWGIPDDGASACSIGELAKKAYNLGVTKGRGGKGVIYVQSAGNGGIEGDNCAADCQINQPYVIVIASADQFGKRTDISEKCTAIFATTYSGNMFKYNGILSERVVSLLNDGKCTEEFYGTSASCPVASGIIALLIQAKPELTYRDVMHIIARSAEVAPLADNDSWYRNGKGFWVSNEFGFGLMNAENMIVLADDWEIVPEKHSCVVSVELSGGIVLKHNNKVSIPFETDACQGSGIYDVVYLEHLEVRPFVTYPRRGDISVSVTSPAGTTSVLLDYRVHDKSQNGLGTWTIMSLHNWGENPRGKWIIHFEINKYPTDPTSKGYFDEIYVKFHGLGEVPAHLEVERQYAAFRLPSRVTELGTYS